MLRTPTLPETATQASLAVPFDGAVTLCRQGQGAGQEASGPKLSQGTTFRTVSSSGGVETPSPSATAHGRDEPQPWLGTGTPSLPWA